MGAERRPVESSRPAAAGLRIAPTFPLEEAAAGHAELAGDLAGDQLRLVEPPRTPAGRARRCPRDDIGTRARPGHAVDEQAGEMGGDGAPVAVLEPEEDLAGPAGEA